jgi:iron-sulfur cluster assembly protein
MANQPNQRPAPILLTERAASHVQELLSRAPEGVTALRLTVESKGCSGFAYKVDYAKAPQPGDEQVQSHGVTIHIDPKAVLYILGTEMDYVETPTRAGFEFNNPLEAGRCGCGESFFVSREELTNQ